jgi:hypothetical protein
MLTALTGVCANPEFHANEATCTPPKASFSETVTCWTILSAGVYRNQSQWAQFAPGKHNEREQ